MRLNVRPALLLIVAIAVALAPAGAGEIPGGAVASVRVMSFNVRLSSADDGEDGWNQRSGIFFKTVRDFGPDLVGFQEVLADQYEALVERLPEYEFSGSARDDGKRQGEWSLIGYRKERFTPVGHGDFWLSEHTDVPGSKSWDAALPRVCSWVRLRETATGRELVFANTHFDHIGVVARLEAAKIISRELSLIAGGTPAVLTGDLNTTEDDPPYATLVSSAAPGVIRWIDAHRAVHPQRSPEERSFHGFKGGTAGSRIDFIFHTAQFRAVEAGIDRAQSASGRFPSDHYAVTAVLRTGQ